MTEREIKLPVKYKFNNFYNKANLEKNYYEKINFDLLNKIVNNFDYVLEKNENIDKNYANINYESMKKIIYNYKNNIPIKYNFGLKDRRTKKYCGFEYGRLYSNESLQMIQRNIRHTIVIDSQDLDIYSCSVSIIYQYSILLKLDCPTIKDYYHNREKYLKELMEKYGLSKDESKNIAISILNLGIRSNKYKLGWIKNMENEIMLIDSKLENTCMYKLVENHVKKVNDEIDGVFYDRETRKKINMKASILNYIFKKTEGEIINEAILFFENKNIEIRSLSFDGLMTENKVTEEILKELTDYIYQKLGLTIYFIIKPFDEKFSNEFLNELELEDKKRTYEELLRDNFDFSKCGITMIKANMGHGKTTQTLKYLDTLDDDTSILYISSRVKLADYFHTKAKKLNFVHYNDIKKNNKEQDQTKKIEINDNRLVIQINSLKMIKRPYDIVILDEIESLFSILVHYDKMGFKNEIINLFKSLINESRQTFLLDANLSQETINLFKKYFKDKEVNIQKKSFKPFQNINFKIITDRNVSKIQNKHLNCVFKNLYEDKKIVIPIISDTYMESLYKSIKNEFPEKKILLASKKHSIDNIDEFKNYDVVIYSPYLMTGSSFDYDYFDINIPYLVDNTLSIFDSSQLLFRVRKFKEMIIYIHINPKKNKLQNKSSILNMWKNYEEYRGFSGILYDRLHENFLEDFTFDLFLYKTLEKVNSPHYYTKKLKQIIERHGLTFDYNNKDNEKMNLIINNDGTTTKFIKHKRSDQIESIINSNKITREDIDDGKNITEDEYIQFKSKELFNLNTDINSLKDGENYIEINLYKQLIDEFEKNRYSHKRLFELIKYGPTSIRLLKDLVNKIYKNKKEDILIDEERIKDELYENFSIDFIEKYNILNLINKEKEFIIDYKEFINWFNDNVEKKYKQISKIDTNVKAGIQLSKLLKFSGLKMTKTTLGKKSDTIIPIIDYNKYNIDWKKCFNFKRVYGIMKQHGNFIINFHLNNISADDDEFGDIIRDKDYEIVDINKINFENHKFFNSCIISFKNYLDKEEYTNIYFSFFDKYKLSNYINKNKKFKINYYEFIGWFNNFGVGNKYINNKDEAKEQIIKILKPGNITLLNDKLISPNYEIFEQMEEIEEIEEIEETEDDSDYEEIIPNKKLSIRKRMTKEIFHEDDY